MKPWIIIVSSFLLTVMKSKAQNADSVRIDSVSPGSYDSTRREPDRQNYTVTGSYLRKGTIGVNPVVMSVQIVNDSVGSADYFYLRRLRDIHLDGRFKKGKLSLFTFRSNTDSSLYESLELRVHNEKVIGKWTDGETILPVKLKRTNTDEFSSPYKKILAKKYLGEYADSMQFIKIATVRFIKDSTSKNGIATLEW